MNRPLIWLPSILQDLEERLQKVLKSVVLVFINWEQLAYVINEWHRVNMNE